MEKINLDEGIENGTIIVSKFFRERYRHDCVVKFREGWYGHPNTIVKSIDQAYRYTEAEAKNLIANMGGGEIQRLTKRQSDYVAQAIYDKQEEKE